MARPPALWGQRCFAGAEHSEAAALNHEQDCPPTSGRNEARSHVKHNVFIAKIGFFSVASIHKVFSPYIYAVNRSRAAACTGLQLPHGLARRHGCSPRWTPQPSHCRAVARVGSSGGGGAGAQSCPWAEGEAGAGATPIHTGMAPAQGAPPSPGSRRRFPQLPPCSCTTLVNSK